MHEESKFVDAEECRSRAQGNWDGILRKLAPSLGPALDAMGKRHVPCPVHGGKDGFRVFKDVSERGASVCNTCGVFTDGISTLMWANGWDFKTTLFAVADEVGVGNGSGRYLATAIRRPPPPAAPPVNEIDSARRREILNKVWCETLSMNAPAAEPARLYLARRGLSVEAPATLRFHPSLLYMDGDEVLGYFPGILAVVLGQNGAPVTIHRTYLTAEGAKAPVPSPKKLMAYPEDRKIIGGAIQLYPATRVLAVAEGLETSLAVMEGTGIPTWATVNATMLESFVPPPGVEQLIVFADKDRPSARHPKGHGQEAAKRLVQRAWAQGIKATAIVPAGEIPDGEKSLDWMDVLRRDGVRGFPSLNSVRLSMLKAA